MLYLEFIDWKDYLKLIGDNGGISHLDILDASQPGLFQFHLVATQPIPSQGVLAVCSALILHLAPKEDAPDPIDQIRREIEKARKEVGALFKTAGVRVRPGLLSVDPPPIFKLRK